MAQRYRWPWKPGATLAAWVAALWGALVLAACLHPSLGAPPGWLLSVVPGQLIALRYQAVGLQLPRTHGHVQAVMQLLTRPDVLTREKTRLLYIAYIFHNQGAGADDRRLIRQEVRKLATAAAPRVRSVAVGVYGQLYEDAGNGKGLKPPPDAVDLLLAAYGDKVISPAALAFQAADAFLTAPPERQKALLEIVRDFGDIGAVQKAASTFTYVPIAARNLLPETRDAILDTLQRFPPVERDQEGVSKDGAGGGYDYRLWVDTYGTYEWLRTNANRDRIIMDRLLLPSSHPSDVMSYLQDPDSFSRMSTVAHPGELEGLVEKSRQFVASGQTNLEFKNSQLALVQRNMALAKRAK